MPFSCSSRARLPAVEETRMEPERGGRGFGLGIQELQFTRTRDGLRAVGNLKFAKYVD
jgi:hypothetical protein